MGTGNSSIDDQKAVEIYDEDFLTVAEAAEELRMKRKAIYNLLAFDQNTNAPGPDSEFPNAYKVYPHRTGEIRIPLSDVIAYKRRRVRHEPALSEQNS